MWYAAQVRSNTEGRVSTWFSERYLQNFWPHTTRLDSRDRTIRRPYFPGYVFVACPELTNEARRQVIEVPNVVRLVGRGTDPEPIPENQIHSVRRVAELEAKLHLRLEFAPAEKFDEGQHVIIRRGPLQGIEGYVAFRKNKLRLVVQVGMLGQATCVEVDACWLEGT